MGEIVDTNGWHTVAAVTYADVNATIHAHASKPASFKYEAPDQSESADCTFGDWALTTGGSGPNISMAITITGGTVYLGPLGSPQSYAVSESVFVITLRAQFVPQSENPNLHDLVPDGETPVTVDSFDPPPTSHSLANAALKDVLQQWLNQNLSSFTAVFATVDMDAEYESEGEKWLKPSFKGYAVEEPATNPSLENSVFGVLCLVDGESPPPQLSYQVSAFAIPDGARASFLISGDKFLQHMVLPAMPLIFNGISKEPPQDNFAILNDGTEIRNTKDLDMAPVTLDNGNVVNPSCGAQNFAMKVNATELLISATDMTFEAFAGVTAHFNYQGHLNLFYDKDKGLLDLRVALQTGDGEITVSKGYEITEWITGGVALLSGILSGVGGAVTKACDGAVTAAGEAAISAGEVVGQDDAVAEETQLSVMGGLIKGNATKLTEVAAGWQSMARVAVLGGALAADISTVMLIAQALSQSQYQSMPKIADLTDAAIGKTVIWPKEVGDFVLDSAQLNGCLQFGLVKAPASSRS